MNLHQDCRRAPVGVRVHPGDRDKHSEAMSAGTSADIRSEFFRMGGDPLLRTEAQPFPCACEAGSISREGGASRRLRTAGGGRFVDFYRVYGRKNSDRASARSVQGIIGVAYARAVLTESNRAEIGQRQDPSSRRAAGRFGDPFGR